MSSFPESPCLLNGAIIGCDPAKPLAALVVFQYDPDTMTCKLEPRTISDNKGDKSEACLLTGSQKETIMVSNEVDVTDQMELGNPVIETMRVNPPLSFKKNMKITGSGPSKIGKEIAWALYGGIGK
jgi:hypothetical protein